MTGLEKVLAYLQAHPTQWHYGRDIAVAANVARAGVYAYLNRLERRGKIARRIDPQLPQPSNSHMRCTQYKVTAVGMLDRVADAVHGGVGA